MMPDDPDQTALEGVLRAFLVAVLRGGDLDAEPLATALDAAALVVVEHPGDMLTRTEVAAILLDALDRPGAS